MKRVAFIIILTIISIFNLLYSQENEELNPETISTIKKADDSQNLEEYFNAKALCEREFLNNPQNNLYRYHLAYCNYKISYIYLRKKDFANFNRYMDEAQKLLRDNIANNNKDAESLALLSTLNGIKIMADYNLGQTLGQECLTLIAKAKEISPDNPRVILQEGIVKFNFPDFFGGDKIKASELFKESISAFTGKSDDKYAWGLLDAYAWYITSLIYLNKHNEAKIYAENALNINPNFAWIKYGLLPKIKE